MLIARHLRHDRIRMEMLTQPLTAEEREAGGSAALRRHKEEILAEIADFVESSAPVANRKRLHTDLVHRERKAGTALGRGLAIPHVRTPTAKEPVVALLRSTPGLEFGAPDGQPAHVFLVLLAPPWDDRLYLKIYKEAGELFLRDDVLPWLLQAESANDVFNFFRSPEQFLYE